jgi:hypothetical protein
LELRHIHVRGDQIDFVAASPSDIQLAFHLEDHVSGLKFSYDPEENGHQLELVILDVAPQNIFSIRVTGASENVEHHHAASDENGRVSFGPFQILESSIIEFPYAMGEVGTLQNLTHESQTVTFLREYQNPVVFVQPLSRNEDDAAVVRILEIQPNGFTLIVHEAPNRDGIHSPEAVSYLVLEAGSWELENGTRLQVGKVETSATVGLNIENSWKIVLLEHLFTSIPTILTQVQSNQDAHWVKTRETRFNLTNFQLALEEEEIKNSPHGSEIVGWLAIESGSGEWNGHPYVAKLTNPVVRHLWKNLTFDVPFERPPLFLASLATYKSNNNAALRYDAGSLNETGFNVMVEEDLTADPDPTHVAEGVAYLAIQDAGMLSAEPYTGG